MSATFAHMSRVEDYLQQICGARRSPAPLARKPFDEERERLTNALNRYLNNRSRARGTARGGT